MTDEVDTIRERLKLALEAGDIGTWTWDRDTDHIQFDHRACEILGLPPGVPQTPDTIAELAHEADRPRQSMALLQSLDGDDTADYDIEYRIIRRSDGDVRWISSWAKRLTTGSGQGKVVGVLRDITAARRADMMLRRAEVRFSEIIAIAADAIISMDSAQRITLFNDGAEQTFGYHRSEVIGRPLDILLPERFRRAHQDHVRQFGQSPTTARRMGERRQLFGLRKSGEEFAAEASIAHLDVEGEQIFAVVLRDISERKRAEDLLLQSRQELEQRVAERTSELRAEMQRREETQAMLVRSQRLEAFGQLTGGIAHDFNNLLTVVTGNLELLEMRLEDTRNRALLKRAQDAAEMGARLTQRLLTFARRRQLETRQINMNDLVASMVDLLRRTIGSPVELETGLAHGLWMINADPSEIENAILNLAINARDAMSKGGKLMLATSNVTLAANTLGPDGGVAPGDYVCLAVTDTGCGMPPDVLAKVFEPFFTTKPAGKGTGLGLSTIYGFVRQQGGTVAIDSTPGVGTTVRLYLPRGEGGKAEEAVYVYHDEPVQAAGVPILLVEDNPEVRQVTRSHLEMLGYDVYEAESGPAAVSILQKGAPVALVLTDVVMAGGMTGVDLAHWVREHRKDVDVVLMSGYADDVLRAHGAEAEPLRLLRKPFTRAELAQILRGGTPD